MNLLEFPAFAGMTQTQVEHLGGVAQQVSFAPGQPVISEESVANTLFLFDAGKLRVHVHAGQESEQELAVLEAPCVVGELEFLAGGTSAASVTALEECHGVSLPYGPIYRRLADHDMASLKLVSNLARLIANRLSTLDHKVAELLGRADPGARELVQKMEPRTAQGWAEWTAEDS